MEFLVFIGFIGLFALFIWIANINTKISALQYQLQKLTSNTKIKTKEKIKDKNKEIKRNDEIFPWEDDSSPVKTKTISALPEKSFKLEDFLLKKAIPVVGVITVILAVGFGVSLAFSNGLIGPIGRIALGIIFSILVLGLGEFLRPKYPKFFDKISAVGIGGLLVSIYLARNYEFATLSEPILSGNQTFIASVLTIATGILLSLRYNTRFLANFTILGGLISPLMVNSAPNPIGLLTYLAILSIAGFVVSIYKKWPEILGILFIGIVTYEIGLLSLICFEPTCNQTPEWFIWSLISPIVFLSFTFILHFLLGSGGIIRKLKNSEVQKNDEFDVITTFEILLFIISVFTANLIGYFVFKNLEWLHFGFFVLAQGFGFFFLSELFKEKKLEIFQEISLGATLISILFATIWEIGESNAFVLSMALALEGLLILFAEKSFGQRIFSFFGRIALCFALFFISSIENFYLSSITILTIITGLLYSINESKTILNKIWSCIAILIASGQIMYWSFDLLPDLIGHSEKFISFIIPIIWGIGLSYSIIKTKENISRIFGFIFITLVCFVGWDEILNGDEFKNFLTLILLLVGSFSVLSSFFIDKKTLQATKSIKKIATISILILTTISILIFGGENLDEPLRTLFWVIWGGTLFGTGISRTWPHFRYFGLGMFFFLIGKIYFVDIWGWETMEKFLAFFCLGIALLGISFVYYKKQD